MSNKTNIVALSHAGRLVSAGWDRTARVTGPSLPLPPHPPPSLPIPPHPSPSLPIPPHTLPIPPHLSPQARVWPPRAAGSPAGGEVECFLLRPRERSRAGPRLQRREQ